MGVYYLSDALRWAAKRAEIEARPMRLSSHERAISLLENSIFGDVSLAAIQGPPGTGKTSVIEGFAERRLDELLTGEKLLIYIAPTNHLVFEAFRRMASLLIQKGYGPRDILFCTRVFGSRIYSGWEKRTLEIGGDVLTPRDLKRLVSGIDTDEVKLVFATEFQRVTARVERKMGSSIRMHVVADEASKTPFFRVFLPIAEEIIKNPESYPLSLTVLGDPQQAITVPEAMKAYRIPLLMTHVERILEEHGMREERFQMLDMTFRLPGPSEVPISCGYYNQALHAFYRAEERLRLLEEAFADNRSAVERSLSRMGIDPLRRNVKKILDGLEEALKAHSPVFVIRTGRFPVGDTFEPRRVEYSTVVSAALLEGSRLSGVEFGVTVVAPYSDLITSFRLRYNKLSENRPQAVTVQSMIGGEDDVVIAMMGKEWGVGIASHGSLGYTFPEENQETLYFREPEVFNVQSSRHKCLYVLIGDVYRLRHEKKVDSRLRRTVEKIEEMARDGKFVTVDVTDEKKL